METLTQNLDEGWWYHSSELASTISRPQLWQYIKVELCKFLTQAKGVWEVWDRVVEVWHKMEPEEVQRLVESMPRRVAAVIKAKGGPYQVLKWPVSALLISIQIIVPMSLQIRLHVSPMDTDWNYTILQYSCSPYAGPSLIYQHLSLVHISLGVMEKTLKMSQTLGQLFESLYIDILVMG